MSKKNALKRAKRCSLISTVEYDMINKLQK